MVNCSPSVAVISVDLSAVFLSSDKSAVEISFLSFPSADRRTHDALYDHGLAGACTYIHMPVLRSNGAGAADKEAGPAKGKSLL